MVYYLWAEGLLGKARPLFQFLPECRLKHVLHIVESLTSSPVIPRVGCYVDALGFLLGLAFQKPGEELLDSLFGHLKHLLSRSPSARRCFFNEK